MKMEKREPSLHMVKDVVLHNTGMTEKEFSMQEREFEIPLMAAVAKVIRRCIERKQPVTIVGDYDCDGVTASAALWLMFTHLGVRPAVRLPRRLSEGYGLSPKIVDEVGSGLLLTVDNGIAAVEAVSKAKGKGLTVIILDHHLPRDDGMLPPADIIIDPAAIPGQCGFTGYCGAGLAYKLAKEMVDDPLAMAKITVFAAIGTVADVVDLTYENRRIVKEGLSCLSDKKCRTTGLAALLYTKGLYGAVTEKDIGYTIGPCINAPGRLLDNGAEKAWGLLTFEGRPSQARALAQEVSALNEKRKEMVHRAMGLAGSAIRGQGLMDACPVCVYVPGLHEGIIGIVAGNIAEDYGVPAFVFTDGRRKGTLKASGRSAGGINLKELMDAALKDSTCVLSYGGHPGAGALCMEKRGFPGFAKKAREACSTLERAESQTVPYDLEIEAGQIHMQWEELEKYGPFGQGNPEPVFKITHFKAVPQYYGWYMASGPDNGNIRFAGKNISVAGYGLGKKYLESGCPKAMELVGTIERNSFTGTLQIGLKDFAPVEEEKRQTALAKLLAVKAAEKHT